VGGVRFVRVDRKLDTSFARVVALLEAAREPIDEPRARGLGLDRRD
jgi:hypothetical protein